MKRVKFLIIAIVLALGLVASLFLVNQSHLSHLTYNSKTISYRNDLFSLESVIEPKSELLLVTAYLRGNITFKDKANGALLHFMLQDKELSPNNAYGGIVATRISDLIDRKQLEVDCQQIGLLEECSLICLTDPVLDTLSCKFYTTKLETQYPDIYSFYLEEVGLLFPKRFKLLGMDYSQIIIDLDNNAKQLTKERLNDVIRLIQEVFMVSN